MPVMNIFIMALLQAVSLPAPAETPSAAAPTQQAAQQQQTPAPSSQTTMSASSMSYANPNRRCHRDTATGSRLETHRICVNREEATEMHEYSRDALDHLTNPQMSIPNN